DDLVVLEKSLVSEPDRIVAPGPLRRQVEAPARFEAAAKIPKAGRRDAVDDKLVLVELLDAGTANGQFAVFETLAPFAAKQGTLSACDPRRNGGVVVRSQCEVIRNLNAEPKCRTGRYDRHQQTGLALHSRVGRGEIRHPGERNAKKFDPRILEVHHLLGFVMN